MEDIIQASYYAVLYTVCIIVAKYVDILMIMTGPHIGGGGGGFIPTPLGL